MKSKKNVKKETKKAQAQEPRDLSYLEEKPNPDHEFPSVGIVETNFVRDHGRSTFRIVDHDPGMF